MYADNKVGIEGAKLLSDALSSNTTLTELNLRGCYLLNPNKKESYQMIQHQIDEKAMN